MQTSKKAIVANSLMALFGVAIFAWFALDSFYAQVLREERRDLETCIGAFRQLLAPDDAQFRREGGRLLAGDRVLNGDFRAADKLQRIFGGVATLYLGDLPISTSVLDGQGKRALGGRLAGPAHSAVLKDGKPYRGEAFILGRPYLAAYDPVRNGRGQVVGALFVGTEKSGHQERFLAVNAPIFFMLALLLASLAAAALLLLQKTRNYETAEADSLRLLRTLMDTIPCPIYYKDAKGRYLGANKAYEFFMGLPKDQLIGKKAHDVWPADLADAYELQDEALRENPGAQTYEGVCMYADGARHDVIFHKGSFFSKQGAIAGSVGVIFDITERKAAERQIKDSNQRLHDIIEFLPDATFVVDAQGRVIAWNKSMEEMSGVRKEQIVGQGDYAYALPFYGERRPILIDLLDRDPEQARPEYPILKREGRTLFAQALLPELEGRRSRCIWGTAAPLFDNAGKRVGAIESMRDISDYKRVEDELRLKNLMQSTQLESSIDGIAAVDEHGRLISYNRRFLEMFRIPQSALDSGEDGNVLRAVMERAALPEGFIEKIRSIYQHPQDTSRDEMPLKDGGVIDRYSAPMVDADGSYYGRVWYFRDVTEQKQAEQVRQRLEAQRHHSQMMESFITQLGHDMRTPLTPLFALMPLIRKKVRDPDLATMIDICSQSVATVRELTEKALKLVSLSASAAGGVLQRVNLAEVVSRCIVENAAHPDGNEASCENGVAPGIEVAAAPEQLRELFGNLLSNAARHSHPGGAIRIEAQQANGWVTVAVRDEGVGVEPADLERIFDEFFKVDASRHDLAAPGLGLAICKRIVANHRGAIWAESGGKGRGLTVRFTLPVHQ